MAPIARVACSAEQRKSLRYHGVNTYPWYSRVHNSLTHEPMSTKEEILELHSIEFVI